MDRMNENSYYAARALSLEPLRSGSVGGRSAHRARTGPRRTECPDTGENGHARRSARAPIGISARTGHCPPLGVVRFVRSRSRTCARSRSETRHARGRAPSPRPLSSVAHALPYTPSIRVKGVAWGADCPFTPQGRWVVCGSWGGQTPAWFTRLHIAYSRPQGRSSFTSSSSCGSSRRTSWRRGEAPTARHHLRQSSGSITRCVSNVRPLTNVRLVLGGAPR